MELGRFTLAAVLTTSGLVAFRLSIMAFRDRWRLGMGIAVIFCLLVFFWYFFWMLSSSYVIYAHALSYPFQFFREHEFFSRLGYNFLFVSLWEGISIFTLLGVIQGIAAALALSAMSELALAAEKVQWMKVEPWRRSLGAAIVAVPIPAVCAITLFLLQGDRFSSVDVGGIVKLALNPAPVGGRITVPQHSGEDLARQSPSQEFVGFAGDGLTGVLRERDWLIIELLNSRGTDRLDEHLKERSSAIFVRSAILEATVKPHIDDITHYVAKFRDYNLFTIDIQSGLIALQTLWLDRFLQLEKGLPVPPYDDRFALHIRRIGCELKHAATQARERLVAFERGREAAASFDRQGCLRDENEIPAGVPNAASDDERLPYLAIGIANLYAAIGSFETALEIVEEWIRLDNKLRGWETNRDNSRVYTRPTGNLLPLWLALRVRIEAARFSIEMSPEATPGEFYRRQVREIRDLFRVLVNWDMSSFAIVRGPGCPGYDVLKRTFFSAPLAAKEPSVATDSQLDLVARLTLSRLTWDHTYLRTIGTGGQVTEEDVRYARAIAGIDYSCFARAQRLEKGYSAGDENSSNTQRLLAITRHNATVTWAIVAIRWMESARTSGRMTGEERRALLRDLRTELGVAVDALERLVAQGSARNEAGDLRQARRVLEQVLALDK